MEKFFKLKENDTNVRTEIIAGITAGIGLFITIIALINAKIVIPSAAFFFSTIKEDICWQNSDKKEVKNEKTKHCKKKSERVLFTYS